MNKREQRKRLIAEAKGIIAAAAADGDRDLTDAEIERTTTIKGEIETLTKSIDASDQARAGLKGIVADEPEDEVTPEDQIIGGAKSTGVVVRERAAAPALSLGEAFVKSAGYKAFTDRFPSGVGSGSKIEIGQVKLGDFKSLTPAGQKANLLTTELAHVQPVRYPTLDMIDRPRLTLLDIIGRGTMAGAFEYVQITGVNRGAAIVEEATGATDAEGNDLDPLKPLSDFTTQLADAKPYTYADGYEVTNQMLADAPAFATYLNTELAYSINRVIEEKLLRGSGVNGEPKGITTTTGVQRQAFDGDFVRTIRKGITRVTRVGGQVTGVLMSPELDEEFDLLQDGNDRYYGNGPFGQGPGTVWGRPRIVSELLSGTNEVILGDFSTIALLDRDGLSIEAFNQHADFARKNKVYVRAELRAGQVIWRPNRLVIAKTTAPAA